MSPDAQRRRRKKRRARRKEKRRAELAVEMLRQNHEPLVDARDRGVFKAGKMKLEVKIKGFEITPEWSSKIGDCE